MLDAATTIIILFWQIRNRKKEEMLHIYLKIVGNFLVVGSSLHSNIIENFIKKKYESLLTPLKTWYLLFF